MNAPQLQLKGFKYTELFTTDGLNLLDKAYLSYLLEISPESHTKLLRCRNGQSFSAIETSELLISCATILESFLARLFNIEEEVAAAQAKTTALNPIAVFKKYFVLRRAKKELNKVSQFPSFEELNNWLNIELQHNPVWSDDKELAVALFGARLLEHPEDHKESIEKLVQWCTHVLARSENRSMDPRLRGDDRTIRRDDSLVANWKSFDIPERIDHSNLVRTIPVKEDNCGRLAGPDKELRLRDGFKLTDERMNAREVQDEVNYCIYCHDHDGDFCSKGFPVKKGDPTQGFKKNPLDLTLTGCPLEEKISEMNFLKRDGFTLGALGMVMVDNPMCPATGHRICNDCMKACIYQKQDPVNIPQIETRVLTDVLDLPWGVEIYDLLTRWNPLRKTQWVAKPYNGLKVMIAGMGPAGFTLAHHLLQEGFAVVGFDGLKIEPLPTTLISAPIYRFSDLKESLDERLMAGFGGVAEYGITVRWDKNFLKLIYLTLMRRRHFQVFGGVRFGGTITVDDVWEMGFDHFVVAVGAGLPRALNIAGSMAPGMRQANDFLMALQLGNAAKANSLTNLQIRLPAIVIGGGLTGVDTATEVQAYYIAQVEKILQRYEILANEHGEDFIQQQLEPVSRHILNEYLEHGKAVRAERERAKSAKQVPDFIKLIRAWGGVTIAYRRSMQESPAYINNHEELQKALEEGIYYTEGLEPAAAELDDYGHVQALICRKRDRNTEGLWVTSETEVRMPARSILVATGTQPNTAYEFEHKGTFSRLNMQYQHFEDNEGELELAQAVEHCKKDNFGPFTSYLKNDKRISLIGDTHPVFHGNVVKAIASGMRTYPKILNLLEDKLSQAGDEAEYQQFADKMNHLFSAHVVNIQRKHKHITELTIKAPIAAKHFKPGQFYRLQNFETHAKQIKNTLLQMEPLALITAECDKEQETLTFVVNETTASAKLCATLKKGEPVSLMGPTGARAKIPTEKENILIIGTPTSFSFVRNYGPALRAAGNQVFYISQLKNKEDIYCKEEVENAADKILWLTEDAATVTATRPQDLTIQHQDAITALHDHAHQFSLTDIDRIFVVGDTDLLRRFQAARQSLLKPHLLKNPTVMGSVYGNMQCMLKGVCAQCLQWQIDPETGERTKAVFACSWQD